VPSPCPLCGEALPWVAISPDNTAPAQKMTSFK
jgi:hypothetical protein